jgi:hypothetical protein
MIFKNFASSLITISMEPDPGSDFQPAPEPEKLHSDLMKREVKRYYTALPLFSGS